MNASNQWKQTGSVSLWHYRDNNKNYRGWHLSANVTGASSLIQLLEALSDDGAGAVRTLSLDLPTKQVLAVPNRTQDLSEIVAAPKWRISMSDDPNQWSFPLQSESACLEIGLNCVPELKRGFSDVRRFQGDYSIGGSIKGSVPLWFWWQSR